MTLELLPFLLPAFGLLWLAQRANRSRGYPWVTLGCRWFFCLLCSLSVALIADHFAWIDRPLWALAGMAFFTWLLAESTYVWLQIHALSLSDWPLFPRFAVNPSGDEWPTQASALKMREELRKAGFRPVQALRGEVAPEVVIRLSHYDSADHTVRLQVAFYPQGDGAVQTFFGLSTELADGRRVVTDNHWVPFGGFFPERWLVERRPLVRSWVSLLARHQARVEASGSVPLTWHTEPLQDVTAQHRELEQLNTECGFFVPPADREELGKISHQGRYRLWKEAFLLNYLGRAVRYD